MLDSEILRRRERISQRKLIATKQMETGERSGNTNRSQLQVSSRVSIWAWPWIEADLECLPRQSFMQSEWGIIDVQLGPWPKLRGEEEGVKPTHSPLAFYSGSQVQYGALVLYLKAQEDQKGHGRNWPASKGLLLIYIHGALTSTHKL